MEDVQVNSYGWNLDLSILDDQQAPVDVSAATSIQFVLKKPDATKIVVSAGFVSDGSDGKVRHEVVQGEITQVGTWRVQAHIITPTQDLWSTVAQFSVKGNLM